jgi:hypothetical protein
MMSRFMDEASEFIHQTGVDRVGCAELICVNSTQPMGLYVEATNETEKYGTGISYGRYGLFRGLIIEVARAKT